MDEIGANGICSSCPDNSAPNVEQTECVCDTGWTMESAICVPVHMDGFIVGDEQCDNAGGAPSVDQTEAPTAAPTAAPTTAPSNAPSGDYFLQTNGNVLSHQKVSATYGGFTGSVAADDYFGMSCANVGGDLNGDDVLDVAIGAPGDDDGEPAAGAMYIVFMQTNGNVLSHQKVSATHGGFTGSLAANNNFGYSVANVGGDLNGDGVLDLVVGAYNDDDGGYRAGAVFIVFLQTTGNVLSHQKVSATHGGFTGSLADHDYFGRSVASVGDLNVDGVLDLAVGVNGDDDGESLAGAVYIVFMQTNGNVLSHQKVSATQGGFTGAVAYYDLFGASSASVGGDLNGDGVLDLVVGAYGDDDGGSSAGAVYIVFLQTSGNVLSHQKVSVTHGGFTGSLAASDYFGYSCANVGGDLNGDGVLDVAVGAWGDGDGEYRAGAVYIVFMQTNGNVLSHQKVSATHGGFTGSLTADDYFGYSCASVGDLNGDDVLDLAVAAYGDDDGVSSAGAVYVAFFEGIPIYVKIVFILVVVFACILIALMTPITFDTLSGTEAPAAAPTEAPTVAPSDAPSGDSFI